MPSGCAPTASGKGTGIDWQWRATILKQLKSTPLAASLEEAIESLSAVGVDVDALKGVLKGKAMEWRTSGHLRKCGLADSFMDFALAIYAYTLGKPEVYGPLNSAMFATDRRGKAAGPSSALLAVMPYAKFLDTALARLPSKFHFAGDCERGVRWVFPSPKKHDPVAHFPQGELICWYEFKSTSTNLAVISREHFCGHGPYPRTHFHIEACRGYNIAPFSFFGEQEAEVLFRPGTLLKVAKVKKRILEPTYGMQPYERDASRSGFPDDVFLEEVLEDGDGE